MNAEALTTLSAKATLIRNEQDAVIKLIKHLRSKEVSWTEIGEALGVSRQAAWRKYHEIAEEASTS